MVVVAYCANTVETTQQVVVVLSAAVVLHRRCRMRETRYVEKEKGDRYLRYEAPSFYLSCRTLVEEAVQNGLSLTRRMKRRLFAATSAAVPRREVLQAHGWPNIHDRWAFPTHPKSKMRRGVWFGAESSGGRAW